jgi:crossover junction endodeoxyribonuclease RuvC
MAIIIGIDPGSLITGYGLVGEFGGVLKCVAYGVLHASPKLAFSERLLKIGLGLEEIFSKYQPEAVALERVFFGRNVDSLTKLGQARGVCLYEAAKAGVKVFEYAPTEIKMSIVGHGRAQKDQVQFMVRGLLGLPPMDRFDMSDALALAIHHVRIQGTRDKILASEIADRRPLVRKDNAKKI